MARLKTLTMTMYNRPQYLRKVLGALSRCIGIDKYIVIMCVEPGCQEVVDLARSVDFAREARVVLNSQVLTCPVNVFNAISLAFLETDFNIHLEDDILLSRDALAYFEHCRDAYAADPDVLTVSAYNNQECGQESYDKVARRRWFTPWGWATWRDRWEGIKGEWDFEYRHGNWDHNINSRLRGGRSEIFPILARAQNIGVTGVHIPSAEWGKAFHYNEFWAGKAKAAPVSLFSEDSSWLWEPKHLDPEVLKQFPEEWLRAASMIE